MSQQDVLENQYIPTPEFYSQVIDSLQDYSIFTLNNDLQISSWNSGAKKIFQYETEEVIGRHFEIIFTKADKAAGIPELEIDTALKEGRALDNRWHICKDESRFYAYGLVFPLLGKDGERLGFVKILKDLTEQKKANDVAATYLKDLEDLNTHKESVLAILSHDLRSPLAGIIGMADHLKNNFDKTDPTEAKEMLNLMHKSAKDELNMLDSLVEWARIKYASDAIAPSPIALSPFVETVFNALKETAQAKEIALSNQITENTSVYADKKMLRSILQNLLSNALQHSSSKGTITFSAEAKENKLVIAVKDTGNGMSKEILDKLFTPQLNTLLKARENNKGAGIGLLLVHGFLERSGEKIWVESTEGVGSTFYFTLPLDKPDEQKEEMGKMELTG